MIGVLGVTGVQLQSCLWRLNPMKEAKMEAELKKWRERYGDSKYQSLDSKSPHPITPLQVRACHSPGNAQPG